MSLLPHLRYTRSPGAAYAAARRAYLTAGAASVARSTHPFGRTIREAPAAPAGWRTLARNGTLAAVAGLLVWRGWEGYIGPSALGWIFALSSARLLGLAGGLLVLGLLTAQWWFLLHLLRQNGRLLVRLEALESSIATDSAIPSQNGAPNQPTEGLPVGAQAPAFSLESVYGETLTLEALLFSE